MTRLARQYDAVAKPAGGYLLFVPRGEAKSATGRPLPTIPLAPHQISQYRVTLADRGRYGAVVATWHNTATGELAEVMASLSAVSPAQAGAEKPAYTLRHTYPDAETAIAAASAKLDALNRGDATLNLTLHPGQPRIVAEAKLTLSGFRDGVNGNWIATQVDHELGSNGYSTRVTAETPKR